MPTYEKATLDSFKVNLKEGKYKDLTGARRAIGKMAAFSAKEKEQAQEIAAKHFGSAAPAVKTAAKAGPKKAAVKTATKKAAKAGPASTTKVAAKKGPGRKRADEVGSTEELVASTPRTLTRTPHPETPEEALLAARELIGVASHAHGLMNACKAADANLDVQDTNKQIFEVVRNATSFITQAASSFAPGTDGTIVPQAQIDVPQTKPSVPNPAPAVAVETRDEEAPAPISPPAPISDSQLSDAEKRAKSVFTQVNPSLGLPAPQA